MPINRNKKRGEARKILATIADNSSNSTALPNPEPTEAAVQPTTHSVAPTFTTTHASSSSNRHIPIDAGAHCVPRVSLCDDVDMDDMPEFPVHIGRDLVVDFAPDNYGVSIVKVGNNPPDQEVLLGLSACKKIVEEKFYILRNALKLELGCDVAFNYALSGKWHIYANSDSMFDVIHLRKVYENVGNNPKIQDGPIHSRTGITLKYAELKELIALIVKVTPYLIPIE